jgi:MFS family permease
MNQKQILLGISSVQHFLVDGLCICCMYLLAPAYAAELTLSAFLTYNVIAFMSQPFTGMLADRMQHRHWLLLSSVVLLSLAVAFSSLSGRVPFGLSLVAVLLGIGNSLFHVWGGKQTVVKVGNDIRALGVFVSTGALGLAVGLVCCSWTLLYVFLLAIVLL